MNTNAEVTWLKTFNRIPPHTPPTPLAPFPKLLSFVLVLADISSFNLITVQTE